MVYIFFSERILLIAFRERLKWGDRPGDRGLRRGSEVHKEG
jgi:hypothetical protein